MYAAYTSPDFYPRPPGGGRRYGEGDKLITVAISIHALRVEGDVIYDKLQQFRDLEFLSTPSGWRATFVRVLTFGLVAIISIHALRVEGDCICSTVALRVKRFLSTPSGWRAT